MASCFLPTGWGLPPVLKHGSNYLKDRICRDVISGKKTICLAVTEPSAGIIVAQILLQMRYLCVNT